MKYTLLFSACLLLHIGAFSQTVVSLDQNGKLLYTVDGQGNKVPDYSYVGYKNSDVGIPVVPVKVTINALAGDNVANIQNAINQVAAMPLNADGFRGAVLLKAGIYNVADSIFLNQSGVVLRGEGKNTIIYASGKSQYNVVIAGGTTHASASTSSSKKILGAYIPFGTRSFQVESGHTFVLGDNVFVQRKPNAAWLTLIGSDTLLNAANPADKNWTTSEMTMNYMRKIVAVNGNEITIDAPVVDAIDATYAQGYLMKYNWSNKVENVGIEDLYFDSQYTSQDDENHGWTAIYFNNIQNAWARNIEVHHYGYSAVNISDYGSFITVDNCKYIDPISQTIQSRKYSFSVNGQRNLVQNCLTDKGRHDYVVGSGATPGPNVFFNCTALNQNADIGPHQKWATGLLFDNIVGDHEQNVQNRVNSGSGHGWTGAQVMYWNCTSPTFIIQNAPGSTNWAVGCSGNVTSVGDYLKDANYNGVVQSTNNAQTFSLFEQQLCERLNNCLLSTSLANINAQNFIDVSVYPNPSSNEFQVQFENKNQYQISLYNSIGEVLFTESISDEKYLVQNNLPAGIYFLQVENNSAKTTLKIIKQN